jgi:hypothetical protein
LHYVANIYTVYFLNFSVRKTNGLVKFVRLGDVQNYAATPTLKRDQEHISSAGLRMAMLAFSPMVYMKFPVEKTNNYSRSQIACCTPAELTFVPV